MLKDVQLTKVGGQHGTEELYAINPKILSSKELRGHVRPHGILDHVRILKDGEIVKL